MVDAGISFKKIKTKLETKNIDLNMINVLFITHDHSDHIKGLDVLIKNYPHIKIYLLASTYEYIKDKFKYLMEFNVKFIDYNDSVRFSDFQISIFETSHDANGSYGLIINDEKYKYIHLTDSGYISDNNLQLIKDCDGILIESNYEDEVIIENKKYPFMTKKRIMSDNGHLSNEQCNKYLKTIVSEKTKYILYGHLSENNNNPSLVSCKFSDFNCHQVVLSAHDTVEVENVW